MAAKFVIPAGTVKHRNYKILTWGLFVVLVVLIAFAYVDVGAITIGGNTYNISLIRLNKAIAFAVAILGLQVVVGYTGQLALGQSFFFGMGGYISAWLVADHGWSVFLTLVVAVPACFIVGVLFGLPALRIKGLYLALVTLGMAAVFPSLVKLQILDPYTNGSGGKLADPGLEAPGWVPFDQIAEFLQGIPWLGQYFGDGPLPSSQEERLWKFTLFMIVAAVCFWLVSNLIQSRPGRAMRAVRDNETGAAVSGVDLSQTKALAFGVASALGGVGGVIYVAELGIASPDDFTQLVAINFIVGLVVGGVGTLSGAVVGGLVIAMVPDWASGTSSLGFVPERWLSGPTGGVVLGIMLILLTFFLPGGIVAGARRLKARIVQIVPQPPGGRGSVDLRHDRAVDPEQSSLPADA